MLGGWLSLSPPQKLGAPIFSQPHREKGGNAEHSTQQSPWSLSPSVPIPSVPQSLSPRLSHPQ